MVMDGIGNIALAYSLSGTVFPSLALAGRLTTNGMNIMTQGETRLAQRSDSSIGNGQATIFGKAALWGMILPITVHGRVSDIWRSYFTRRIIWEAGQRLAFASPFVTQVRL